MTLAFHLLSSTMTVPMNTAARSKTASRFFRELIEDTKDAVGDTCAVAVRFAVDELLGNEVCSPMAKRRRSSPCLPNFPICGMSTSATGAMIQSTSRFEKEGFQEKYISFVKNLTTKPVVGVGRYTSPDSMVSAIQRGVMDMIGAARPSIADPFLPNKIKEDRIEDIRECIGCNICVTGDTRFVPIRCTQNPTMGEEWRRGWHPETIAPKKSEEEILIVGAGPAGLEAARAWVNVDIVSSSPMRGAKQADASRLSPHCPVSSNGGALLIGASRRSKKCRIFLLSIQSDVCEWIFLKQVRRTSSLQRVPPGGVMALAALVTTRSQAIKYFHAR